MAAYWDHKCDGCGLEFTTSGGWEFYRDAVGEVRPYGHPLPASEEAAAAGVYGTCCTAWCPACQECVDVVEVEMGSPLARTPFMWLELGRQERQPRVCPKCGGTETIVDGDPHGETAPCPRCGGKIRIVEHYMS